MALVGDDPALITDYADIGELLKSQFENQVVGCLGNLLLGSSTERFEFIVDTD
jgi:hypothetical protein